MLVALIVLESPVVDLTLLVLFLTLSLTLFLLILMPLKMVSAIKLTAKNIFSSIGEYDIDNTSVWVCTSIPSPGVRGASVTPKEDPVLWYMAVVGLVLSLVSIILVLVTHCVFKELRSLPGKNCASIHIRNETKGSGYYSVVHFDIIMIIIVIIITII